MKYYDGQAAVCDCILQQTQGVRDYTSWQQKAKAFNA